MIKHNFTREQIEDGAATGSMSLNHLLNKALEYISEEDNDMLCMIEISRRLAHGAWDQRKIVDEYNKIASLFGESPIEYDIGTRGGPTLLMTELKNLLTEEQKVFLMMKMGLDLSKYSDEI